MKRVIHILLIEDDKLDQIDVRRTLERRGILHRLTVLTNGEDVLKLMHAGNTAINPDIIILDLNMPRMNGFEVLDNIREFPGWGDVKVFVLTTSDEPSDKVKAKEYNISGYIVKPLKLESPSSLDAFNLMIDLMNM